MLEKITIFQAIQILILLILEDRSIDDSWDEHISLRKFNELPPYFALLDIFIKLLL